MSTSLQKAISITPTATPTACDKSLNSAVKHMEIWAFDPAWWRVEWKDDLGESLGQVSFERRLAAIRPTRRVISVCRRATVLSEILGWLREVVTCRLSTN